MRAALVLLLLVLGLSSVEEHAHAVPTSPPGSGPVRAGGLAGLMASSRTFKQIQQQSYANRGFSPGGTPSHTQQGNTGASAAPHNFLRLSKSHQIPRQKTFGEALKNSFKSSDAAAAAVGVAQVGTMAALHVATKGKVSGPGAADVQSATTPLVNMFQNAWNAAGSWTMSSNDDTGNNNGGRRSLLLVTAKRRRLDSHHVLQVAYVNGSIALYDEIALSATSDSNVRHI